MDAARHERVLRGIPRWPVRVYLEDLSGQERAFGDMISAVERKTGSRYERRSRGGPDDLRAVMDEQRRRGDVVAATMGAYQLYMITGQTSLDHLQNDRYPDIRFHTFEEVLADTAS